MLMPSFLADLKNSITEVVVINDKKLDNNFAEDAFDTSPKLKTDLQKELRYFLHFGKSFFLPP